MLSLPFIAYKYMELNRLFVLTAVIGGGIYLFWIWAGYPQFYAPGWFPDSPVVIGLVPKSTSGIELSGYLFNSAFKIVALLPALLFFKKPEAQPSSAYL